MDRKKSRNTTDFFCVNGSFLFVKLQLVHLQCALQYDKYGQWLFPMRHFTKIGVAET